MSSAKPDPPAESVRVNIFGQTYSLRSAGGGERVLRVAELVDERMREIASHLAVHDAAKVAVLAALNLADELELVREHYEREIESLLTAPPEPAEGEALDAPAPPAEWWGDDGGRGVRAGAKLDEAAPATFEVEAPPAADEAADFSFEGEARGSWGPDEAAGAREAAGASRREDEAGRGDGAPSRGDETSRDDDARRSWFDEIFDTDFSSGGSGRLSSQVSSRLKRLRQTTRGGTIREGGPGEDGRG